MRVSRACWLLAAVLLGIGICAGPAVAVTRLPGFRSPSGNISCLFVPGRPVTLLCGIAHADYAAALQDGCMARATVDWHGFTLPATRKGSVSCSGGILYNPDTQRPSYVTLAYGKRWQQGVFTCDSRVTGVTCRNRNGHGLFLSRQAWRAW
jgi:hypothetical protein